MYENPRGGHGPLPLLPTPMPEEDIVYTFIYNIILSYSARPPF